MKRLAWIAVALASCAERQAPPPDHPLPSRVAAPVPTVPSAPGVIVPPPASLPDGGVVSPIDSCGYGRVKDVVGKTFAHSLSGDVQKRSGARTVRVIRPGTMVTMDFRPDRLNIDVDDKNLVTGLRCG